MDIRQVEYVLAVIDHGGFTRAARAVHVAQPSLSQSIRRLEQELGSPLFSRAGRTVRVTEAGRAFEKPARRALRELEAARAAVAGHGELLAGTVDVVALPTLVPDPLAGVLARFRELHPAIRVRIHDPGTAARLATMVGDGRAGIGLTERGPERRGLERRALLDQELLAVLPPGERARPGRLTLEQLADRALVTGPPGTGTRKVVEEGLAELGLDLTVAVETAQREAVVPLVLAGVGPAVLPAPLAEEAGALGATVVPLVPPLVRRVDVIWSPDELPPAGVALLDLLTSTLRADPESSPARPARPS